MTPHSSYTPEFLRFVAAGSLCYARCSACGQVLSFAQRLCSQHPHAALEWLPASGKARLHSFAVYRIAYGPGQTPPYTVAVVELEEGPRLTSALTGPDRLHPRIGSALTARFEPSGRLVFSAVSDATILNPPSHSD